MSGGQIDPEAPRPLAEATQAVRKIILKQEGMVAGSCVEAGMILAWKLRQDGFPAEMESRSACGDFHWCIRSGPWILDPTSGSWGHEPVLVFREGSGDDWHGPGEQGTAEVSEEEIVSRFALSFRSPGCERDLLSFAGLPHLVSAIEDAREEARIERLEEYLD